jgi:hypothetical protein
VASCSINPDEETTLSMIRLATAAMLLACVPAAHAQDAVIGLLTLPGVFGPAPCEPFQPSEVTLFAQPDSAAIAGHIRVARNWTFHEAGGCEGLEVDVHDAASGRRAALPTREAGYELPAVIVLERRGDWFRVRLDEGTAWIRASEHDEFLPIERLLEEGLTYLTEAWDGRLAPSPGAAAAAPAAAVEQGPAVRVVELRRAGDRLWVHVEVLGHSPCDSAEPPVVARGWLPVHAASGEPAIWFFSRGC